MANRRGKRAQSHSELKVQIETRSTLRLTGGHGVLKCDDPSVANPASPTLPEGAACTHLLGGQVARVKAGARSLWPEPHSQASVLQVHHQGHTDMRTAALFPATLMLSHRKRHSE